VRALYQNVYYLEFAPILSHTCLSLSLSLVSTQTSTHTHIYIYKHTHTRTYNVQNFVLCGLKALERTTRTICHISVWIAGAPPLTLIGNYIVRECVFTCVRVCACVRVYVYVYVVQFLCFPLTLALSDSEILVGVTVLSRIICSLPCSPILVHTNTYIRPFFHTHTHIYICSFTYTTRTPYIPCMHTTLMFCSYSLTHSLILSLSLSYTHTRTHTHTLILSLSLAHTHTHTYNRTQSRDSR